MSPGNIHADLLNGPHRLAKARRKLRFLRCCGWLVFLVEVCTLAVCVVSYAEHHGRWFTYGWTLALVVAWFHGLPLLLGRILARVKARVGPDGDRWRIGKYSEAELRAVIRTATAGLPALLRRTRVEISEIRCATAWTWLSFFRLDARQAKPIVLTSGSLHYLERDELMAVLLHEIGHHMPENRPAVFGGWLLTHITLHAAAMAAYAYGGSSENLGIVVFIVLNFAAGAISAWATQGLACPIEHLCDAFAAQRVGAAAMINALLKIAEDSELTEVVLVWAARELIYEKDIDVDDLILAFAESRPYGRIFHENLIRHAAEVVKRLREGAKSRPGGKAKRRQENPELKALVEKRRSRDFRRIRWRRFDRDNDGVLTAAEIACLCNALRSRPDDVLVTSIEEAEPTTHPPCRDRILLLHEAFP
jgi:Zn-dependent protease with chaperone function